LGGKEKKGKNLPSSLSTSLKGEDARRNSHERWKRKGRKKGGEKERERPSFFKGEAREREKLFSKRKSVPAPFCPEKKEKRGGIETQLGIEGERKKKEGGFFRCALSCRGKRTP